MGEKDGREKWDFRSRERKWLSLVSLTSAFEEQGGAGQRTWLLWVLRHPCKCSFPQAQYVTARSASYRLISLLSPGLWIHQSISRVVFTLLFPTDISVQVPWDADLQLSIIILSKSRESKSIPCIQGRWRSSTLIFPIMIYVIKLYVRNT